MAGPIKDVVAMPGFDGTGPRGQGPFTGRGMGYCVIKLDSKDVENQRNKGKEVFDMPRGDGTGPMGLGPMTGRAAGYCAGYNIPGYMNPVRNFVLSGSVRGISNGVNPIPGRGYFGRGRGFFGRGGGRGWRNWYYATGLPGWARAGYGYPAFGGGVNPFLYPYGQEITPKQEADILKNEAVALKEQLEDIQSRIETLEKAQTHESKDE